MILSGLVAFGAITFTGLVLSLSIQESSVRVIKELDTSRMKLKVRCNLLILTLMTVIHYRCN